MVSFQIKVLLFFQVCFALFLSNCKNHKKEETFISGKFSNAANKKIYLEQITEKGDAILDSTVADANGEFKLSNKADELDYYLLRSGDKDVAFLILKGGENVAVTGDAQNLEHTYDVEGSPDTRLMLSLKRFDFQLSDSMNRIYSAVLRDTPWLKDSVGRHLQAQYDSLIRNFSIGLIKNNFTSLVALSASQYLDRKRDFALFEQLNDSLKNELGDNRYVAVFSKQVADMKKLPAGSPAPEINLPDPSGKTVSLSSLKGKVVVIDFWASWCGPCRREMPEMVALYNDFKNRGLEIYGVSLDDNEDAWKNAVSHDKITWLQVSELKKWDSDVVAVYGIEEIPQTILLDRQGNIVAKGLNPHELRIRLQEIL